MARRSLKTPVLVGVAAIAVAIGAFSLRDDSDVVDVVPHCTAPQGEFCLQLELHEGMLGRPKDANESRVFDLIFIEVDRAALEATLTGLNLLIYNEEDMYAGQGAYLSELTQAKFDGIPADYRVTGGKNKVWLEMDVANYIACAFSPEPFRGEGVITGAYCTFIVPGDAEMMDDNVYVDGLQVDIAP